MVWVFDGLATWLDFYQGMLQFLKVTVHSTTSNEQADEVFRSHFFCFLREVFLNSCLCFSVHNLKYSHIHYWFFLSFL